jgi:hypothetical protein
MKRRIKILGYYKRIRDNSEFICYEESDRICLTNGVTIWRNNVKERFLPQCEKVNEINVNYIAEKIKRHYPHHLLLEILNQTIEEAG